MAAPFLGNEDIFMKKDTSNIMNCSSVIVVGKTGKGIDTLINACFRTKPKHIVRGYPASLAGENGAINKSITRQSEQETIQKFVERR